MTCSIDCTVAAGLFDKLPVYYVYQSGDHSEKKSILALIHDFNYAIVTLSNVTSI